MQQSTLAGRGERGRQQFVRMVPLSQGVIRRETTDQTGLPRAGSKPTIWFEGFSLRWAEVASACACAATHYTHERHLPGFSNREEVFSLNDSARLRNNLCCLRAAAILASISRAAMSSLVGAWPRFGRFTDGALPLVGRLTRTGFRSCEAVCGSGTPAAHGPRWRGRGQAGGGSN